MNFNSWWTDNLGKHRGHHYDDVRYGWEARDEEFIKLQTKLSEADRELQRLTKEVIRLNEQLTKANEVALFYAALQEDALEKPVMLYNFNKAVSYCYDYCLPIPKAERHE